MSASTCRVHILAFCARLLHQADCPEAAAGNTHRANPFCSRVVRRESDQVLREHARYDKLDILRHSDEQRLDGSDYVDEQFEQARRGQCSSECWSRTGQC